MTRSRASAPVFGAHWRFFVVTKAIDECQQAVAGSCGTTLRVLSPRLGLNLISHHSFSCIGIDTSRLELFYPRVAIEFVM